MALRDIGIGDYRALGLADALCNQGAALRQQALSDQHIVGAVAERNANVGRLS